MAKTTARSAPDGVLARDVVAAVEQPRAILAAANTAAERDCHLCGRLRTKSLEAKERKTECDRERERGRERERDSD